MFPPTAEQLSLYLHVPMCGTRCSYCSFYSEPKENWQAHKEQYADRLLGEVAALQAPKGGFHTLYIGGGSPLYLGYPAIVKILTAVREAGSPEEVTLEVNPEQVDMELLSLCGSGLISRISIGIQSMDDRLLTLLGRSATADINRSALLLLQEARERYGIDISVDLMVALPTQKIEQAIADIDMVLGTVDVQHLSLYCLTVEEGTALAQRVAAQEVLIHNEDSQALFLDAVNLALQERGFAHYEVSNWAKHQRYSRHNTVYWSVGDYLGLGSSAASTVGTQHWEQSQDLATYAASPLFSGYEVEEISLTEQVEEYLMMGLRTAWGIDKLIFANRFGLSFDSLFQITNMNLKKSWYKDTPQTFSLTEKGWLVLDEILLRLVLQIPESLDPLVVL